MSSSTPTTRELVSVFNMNSVQMKGGFSNPFSVKKLYGDSTTTTKKTINAETNKLTTQEAYYKKKYIEAKKQYLDLKRKYNL